jgi:peptidoglycan-associated lipoprotein
MFAMATLGLQACVSEPPPVAPETSPLPPRDAIPARPVPPPVAPPPPAPPPVVPPEILDSDEEFGRRTLEELNRESPLEPVYFGLDSSELDDGGRRVAEANADVMRRFPTWVVTIEGHCDERGTPEYNLGLGERRALAAQQHMIALGVDASRVRTVSYGKEFPFDPGHEDSAWAANRRAHFVISSK